MGREIVSLQYLLDGYNIVYKMPSLENKTLEDQRYGLIQHIERNAPQGSNAVTIVFDGRSDVYSPRVDSCVDVVYSRGESADDKICKMVQQFVYKKRIVVVTDDRSIQYSVRSQGARICNVGEFLKSKEIKSVVYEKKVSRYAAKEITEEFKEIWGGV